MAGCAFLPRPSPRHLTIAGARRRGRTPDEDKPMKEPFKTDLEAIRKRAREKMEQGAITGAYLADREQVLSVLNDALATEACW